MQSGCQICVNPNRLKIDRELVSGASRMSISNKYGVNYTSLTIHFNKHLSRQLMKTYDSKDINHGLDLLTRINKIITRAERIFHRNYKKNKDVVALKALGEQRQTYELIVKMSVALHDAKMAELQLEREKQFNKECDKSDRFAEDIKILTKDELKVYLLLQRKIRMQNSKLKCIPRAWRSSDLIFEEGMNDIIHEEDINSNDVKKVKVY